MTRIIDDETNTTDITSQSTEDLLEFSEEQMASLMEAMILITKQRIREQELQEKRKSSSLEDDEPESNPNELSVEEVEESIALSMEERLQGQSPDNIQTARYLEDGSIEISNTPIGTEVNIGQEWGERLAASIEEFRAQQAPQPATIDAQLT